VATTPMCGGFSGGDRGPVGALAPGRFGKVAGGSVSPRSIAGGESYVSCHNAADRHAGGPAAPPRPTSAEY
jgi:hypothetical protein